MQTLKKNCLIFGGGSDIGGAIVRELAKAGHNVFSTFFNSRKEAQDLPGETMWCDIRNSACVDEVIEKIPVIDIVVTSCFPFLESANMDFKGFLKANEFLTGHVYAITEASKKMAIGGKIFNILGQCVERGLPGASFYSAAFAFLNNWGNSINGDEGKRNWLQVCNLLLGPVETREWSGLSEEIVNRYRAKVASFIEPQQIAEIIKLLSEQRVVTSTLKLDGFYGN